MPRSGLCINAGALLNAACILIVLLQGSAVGSNAVISYGAGASTHVAPSPIALYRQDSTPLTNITDSAGGYTLNLTDNWVTAMSADSQGNIYLAETDGRVYSLSPSGRTGTVGSPFAGTHCAKGKGPVTGLAAVPSADGGAPSPPLYLVILTMEGYLYSYSFANGTWFNFSAAWGIVPASFSHSSWTSLSSFGYDVFAVTITGDVLEITFPPGGVPLYTFTHSSSPLPVLSSVAIEGTAASGKFHAAHGFVIFAISASAETAEFISSSATWTTSGSIPASRAISIASGPDSAGNSRDHYVYAISPENSTPVYVAQYTFSLKPVMLSFAPLGVPPFDTGTVSEITIHNSSVVVSSTGGEIAQSAAGGEWSYTVLPISPADYTCFILSSVLKSVVYSSPLSGVNLTSLKSLSLNFSNLTSVYPEMSYSSSAGLISVSSPAPLSPSFPLNMTVTVVTDTLFNSQLVSQCTVLFGGSVVLTFHVTLHLINHFYYEVP